MDHRALICTQYHSISCYLYNKYDFSAISLQILCTPSKTLVQTAFFHPDLHLEKLCCTNTNLNTNYIF